MYSIEDGNIKKITLIFLVATLVPKIEVSSSICHLLVADVVAHAIIVCRIHYIGIMVKCTCTCKVFSDSRSSQCSTTGVTKAVVCVILSVGWCI